MCVRYNEPRSALFPRALRRARFGHPGLSSLAVLSILLAFLALSVSAEIAPASAFETSAKQAILIDEETGAILFEKNADAPFPPASMGMLMTLEVVFDALKTGKVRDDQTIRISEHAWRTGGAPSGGTTMFAELKSEVPIIDLVRGVIVHLAHDAAIALAEGLAGSEKQFATRMNARAKEIGLTGSTFVNPTGYDDVHQQVTARDMARLARHIIDTYPDRYPLFSLPDFTWNDIYQRNKNSLIPANFGVDGLMVGGANEHELGAVASAKRDGRRLILAFYGLGSKAEREKQAKALFNWGFESFGDVRLYAVDEVVGEARVFGGESLYVPLVGKGPIRAYMELASRKGYRARVAYEGPIRAPVKKGLRVGSLQITRNKIPVQSIPLYTARSVAVGGFIQRARDGLIEAIAKLWY